MLSINENIIISFNKFGNPPVGFATPSKLSKVKQAPWTNRVPLHEPWARSLMVDTPNLNSMSDEYLRNTSHNPQYTDNGDLISSEPIGRIEGDVIIKRGPLWRR